MKSPSTHFVVITCRHLQQDKFSSTVRQIISPSTVVIPVSLYDKRNPLLLLDYSSKSYDQRCNNLLYGVSNITIVLKMSASTARCIQYLSTANNVIIYFNIRMYPISWCGKWCQQRLQHESDIIKWQKIPLTTTGSISKSV